MLRHVEGLTSEETARSLGVTEETVRVRLHRARHLLRDRLSGGDLERLGVEPFAFAGERCNRIVARVLVSVGLSN